MVIMSRVTISTATRGSMLDDSMRFYLFNNALFLPWLTFFTIGRPVVGVICLILQITIIGWIPATIWSVYALGQYKTDKKIEYALNKKGI
jgi:hypothetical protein